MTYFPIYLLFSLSAGSLLKLLPILLPQRAGHILTVLLSFLLTLLFAAELIAKHTLQAYYPLSTLETAAGNRLSDYAGVILPAIAAALPLLLLFFLPALLLCPLFRWGLAQGQPPRRSAALFAAAAVAFHLLGLAVVHAPWPGDLTPAKLYRSDTNFDDQVEQLGLVTMLRLDVKHMLFPAKAGLDSDFDGLDSSGDGSGGDISAVEEQPVIDTSPNVMDVDLDSLAANAPNEDVSWLANYFSIASPTRKNEYTGMFEGVQRHPAGHRGLLRLRHRPGADSHPLQAGQRRLCVQQLLYRRTLDKLRLKLLESGLVHTVTLKQTECRKNNKKIAAAVYLYQADNDGEWGELRFDFESGAAEIVKLADWDTIKSNVFAKTAIRYVQSSPEVRMLRFVVVPFELETLGK